MAEEQFYWCRRHQRVEREDRCGSVHVLGPFPTAEEARDHQATTEARNEAWDDADERWENWGPKSDDSGPTQA